MGIHIQHVQPLIKRQATQLRALNDYCLPKETLLQLECFQPTEHLQQLNHSTIHYVTPVAEAQSSPNLYCLELTTHILQAAAAICKTVHAKMPGSAYAATSLSQLLLQGCT
jgi:hypothetical protein